jgi:sulfate/thiosulfate-binding protein
MDTRSHNLNRRHLSKLGLVACIVLMLAGCGSAGADGKRVTLVLGAYTTPREAYSKAILPEFQKYWRQKTGQQVEFQESYQASGAQSRAIISGFEADVAALSLESDIARIAQSGLIQHDWKANQFGGIVSTSIVVIAVRPGNPAGIRDWTDLTKPGLKLLTPDPKTSGGAQWNIAAIYGAAFRGRLGVGCLAGEPENDSEAAKGFLKRVLANVSIMDKGARESITNFEKGVGDAAITYENEVLVGWQAGRKYDYVIPCSTILIENPVALIDTYVDKHNVRSVAEAFVNFLWTKEVQRVFAQYGLRPRDPEVGNEIIGKNPAKITDLWKIDDLGGWQQVAEKLFGPSGAYTRSFEELHATP